MERPERGVPSNLHYLWEKDKKTMMVSTQRTTVDPYMKESEEQQRSSLSMVIETIGGLVSWEKFSRMMVTIVWEAL